MIAWINPDDPRLFSAGAHPCLAPLTESWAALHRPGAPVECWLAVAEEEGPARGTVCRVGNGTVIASLPPEDWEEGAAFLRMIGFAALETNLPPSFFPELEATEFAAMICPHLISQPPVGPEVEVLPAQEWEPHLNVGTFSTLQCRWGALPGEARDGFLSTSLLRQRQGLGQSFFFLLGGEPVALSAASPLGHTWGTVGAVAVDPKHQGRGLGRLAAWHAARFIKEQDKVPVLCCVPPLAKLYRPLGFEEIQPVYRYVAKG